MVASLIKGNHERGFFTFSYVDFKLWKIMELGLALLIHSFYSPRM